MRIQNGLINILFELVSPKQIMRCLSKVKAKLTLYIVITLKRANKEK